MNDLELTLQEPFGIVITCKHGGGDLSSIDPSQIYAWIREHKLLVFRGFKTMPKQEFALFGQRLGEPLQWPFGAINDLKVKPDAENYIFTDHAVPMHWDGAFAGKIPHIILFQCIVAPQKANMGGTTFCNTASMLAHAGSALLEAWGQVAITYRTEKIVHYGGKITQRLIDQHPVDGTPVLRYAEPVEDLNPVTLEIQGLQGISQADFVAQMRQQIYDPAHLYTHRWEDGDIVMADNHCLLHGREAFGNPSERYIQRINLLHRPPLSLQRRLKHWLTIRRKEFFVAELPIFLIPLCLCLQDVSNLLQPALWIGLLALVMLFNIGDMINCLKDYELDAIYKSHLSNAVYELGKRNVKLQMLVSGILAMVLTAISAWWSDRLYLIPVTIVGLLIGMQYSAPPFKFKSQGLWQLLCLWGIIFWGPMAYTAVVVSGLPSPLMLGIFAAFGFLQMGIIMLNTAEDFPEDKAAGLRTIIVFLGLHRAMHIAIALVIGFGIILQALLVWRMLEIGVPPIGFLGIGILALSWMLICWEYWQVIALMQGKSEDEAAKVLKKNGMKVPRWLKISAYATLGVSILIAITSVV